VQRLCGLVICFVFGLTGVQAWAAPSCNVKPAQLRFQQETEVLLCGEDLPPRIAISGLDEANVELVYQQPLRFCTVGDQRPGFQLVLKAMSKTTDLRLDVADGETGESLCEMTLEVLPSVATAPPDWLNAMPAEDAKFIDVEGIRTRYFDKGTGPALILVHGGQAGGANNSAQKWEQNFDGLAESFRVIALDRLAQASTDNLARREDYADYFQRDADHLEAFIDALGLKSAALVGHSQGGWPITRVALNRPDLVTCLVNVDTVMVPDDRELMREALSFLIYMATSLHPESGPTFHSARRGIALRSPSGNNITDEKARRIVAQYNADKTQEARSHLASHGLTPQHPSFAALKAEAFRDIAAGQLQAQSLVVWGARDPQVPRPLGDLFQSFLMESGVASKFVVMENAGHAPFAEFPEAFNDVVREVCLAQ